MIVFCILRQAQSRVLALALIDSEVFAYVFMNKFFAQQHHLLLHQLTHSRRLREFDDQVALIDDITHVIEITMILDEHIERLFFYVTELSQYFIIMNLSWLCHHVIDVNFEHNILILSFFFCLNHCCSFLVKIYDLNQQEENFSFEVNKVAFSQSRSQFTHKKQLSSRIAHKKQFSLQIAHKKQFSLQIAHKKQFSIQFARKKQFSFSFAWKKQFSFQFARKKQSSLSFTRKKQLSFQFAHKKQFSSQFACKKQLSFSSAHKKQYNFSFAHEKSTNTQLIHKKQISFNLVSRLKQEASSRILQVIQKEYSSKIKCWNSFLSRISVVSQADQFDQSSIQLDIVELRVRSFDHAAHVKDIEVFSVTLKKIDVFLNLESISSSSLDSDESKSRRATLTIHSKNSSTLAQFLSRSQHSMYDKNHRLNLHQMKKKFHLTAFTTQEDLEVYWQSKNVDSVTILSFRYSEFLDVFFKKNVDILSSHWAHDHVIHLKEDAQFSIFALYDMSRDEILELRRYLNENLSKDFIRVSRFQMIISVLFVKKLEEELCFCVNYRDLNAITVKNRYSLSLISETLNRLSRAKIFIKLNIISAFNRLWIKEEDEALIAFCTRFELFEYLVMLFDLCNESVSFQKYINNTLCKHLDKFCTAYLNDILIYFDNELEHEIHVKLILRKLREADLQMNIIKCEFHVTQVSYLELIIIIEEIKMNSSKIDIIVNWLILINVKDVQSFLDFANFYKRFIYDYSRIAISLTRLIRKDVLFVWFQKCQIAFNILKKVFTFKIILRHYNSNHKIVIEINASNYVFKNIFFQYNENEILHSVTYFSKKHNSVECNYEIYDKELMIIVRAFEKWWSELEDSIYSVEMITDHKNLEYFMSTKQLSRRQARWSEFLSRFNYHIAYHFDKIDDKSNALTRRSEDLSKEKNTFDSRHQYQH